MERVASREQSHGYPHLPSGHDHSLPVPGSQRKSLWGGGSWVLGVFIHGMGLEDHHQYPHRLWVNPVEDAGLTSWKAPSMTA